MIPITEFFDDQGNKLHQPRTFLVDGQDVVEINFRYVDSGFTRGVIIFRDQTTYTLDGIAAWNFIVVYSQYIQSIAILNDL